MDSLNRVSTAYTKLIGVKAFANIARPVVM